jgi:hypothetical protein
MNLDNVIEQLEARGTQKTAAIETNPSVDARLQGALAATLEKTAANVTPPTAADDPVQGLMKMATELAGVEKEAELAMANMLGQAFADGAIAKFAAYDASVKIAMAQQAPADNDSALIKAAAEQGYADVMTLAQTKMAHNSQTGNDSALIKAAAEQGYADAMNKVAEAQYEHGFNEQVAEIHKVACGEFLKGAAETEILLNSLQAAGR